MKDDYEGFAKVGVGEGISDSWEDYLSDERPDI